MGPNALTTSSILITLNNLAFAVIIGFCDATSILVGQYIGRNRKAKAEKVVYNAWRIQIPYLIFLGVLYIGFPDIPVDIFQSTNKGIDSSVDFAVVKEMAKIFGVSTDEIIGLEANGFAKEEAAEESAQNEDSAHKETQKQFLAVCEECNKPLYVADEIVRKYDKVLCKSCCEAKEKRNHSEAVSRARKRRILSFVFGSLACAAMFAFSVYSWNNFPFENFANDAMVKALYIIWSISMFTFVSCCILDNNFVGELFVNIASWSIKLPGLIFTFDMDGCLWFIGMKILFAILGVIFGFLTVLLALMVGGVVSLFVYPFAITKNIKHPERDY
jgi:hypothetical protein